MCQLKSAHYATLLRHPSRGDVKEETGAAVCSADGVGMAPTGAKYRNARRRNQAKARKTACLATVRCGWEPNSPFRCLIVDKMLIFTKSRSTNTRGREATREWRYRIAPKTIPELKPDTQKVYRALEDGESRLAGTRCCGTHKKKHNRESGEVTYQDRVAAWITACFPASAQVDVAERSHRFLEEALELA